MLVLMRSASVVAPDQPTQLRWSLRVAAVRHWRESSASTTGSFGEFWGNRTARSCLTGRSRNCACTVRLSGDRSTTSTCWCSQHAARDRCPCAVACSSGETYLASRRHSLGHRPVSYFPRFIWTNTATVFGYWGSTLKADSSV